MAQGAKIPQISDAEWEVMKIVWERGPVTAGDVVEHVAAENHWRPRTIKTLLNRLVQKKAVEFEVEGRRYLYKARVTKDAVVRRESRSFLARVFDGAVAPALVHFLEHADLTPDEIRKLKETLEREGRP